MKATMKLMAVVVLLGLVGTTAAAETASAFKQQSATYILLADSSYAEGCTGSGWPYGCMCPIQLASDFSGAFTLTPEVHVPQGHHGFQVDLKGWTAEFGDDVVEITGSGYYDIWTELDGTRWHALTLDMVIDGEEVQLLSGALEYAGTTSGFPLTIEVGLDSDTECWGYWIMIDARRVRSASNIKADMNPNAEVD